MEGSNGSVPCTHGKTDYGAGYPFARNSCRRNHEHIINVPGTSKNAPQKPGWWRSRAASIFLTRDSPRVLVDRKCLLQSTEGRWHLVADVRLHCQANVNVQAQSTSHPQWVGQYIVTNCELSQASHPKQLTTLQLHGTLYKDCGLSVGSAPSRSLAQRLGMRFRVGFIRLNQPILLRNSSKHFYLITLSSCYFVV